MAAVAALAVSGARAQDAAGNRAFSIVPSASISETVTDNVNLASTGQRAESITQLGAQVRMASRSGRVQGSLDYSLSGLVYARGTSADTIQNSLNAAGQAELVPNHVFVDAGATVSQQAISAFGVQTTDPALNNANRTEVSSYHVSPSVRGHLASFASFVGQLNYSATHSGAGVGNSTASSGSFSLASGPSFARLGWNLVLSRQLSDYSGGRTVAVDNATAGLSFAVTPELRFSADAGRQYADVITAAMQGNATWDVGVDWAPTERTKLSAKADHQYFGNGHSISFEHRMPRSAVMFSSSRSAVTSTTPSGVSSFMTAYDLFFLQLASIQPDPVQRDLLVRSLLQSYGLSPTTQVSIGFLSSTPTLQNNNQLSFSMQGLRTTFTVSAMRNSTSPLLAPNSGQVGQQQNTGAVQQSGLTLNAGHRLTPQSGLSLTLSGLRTAGSTSAQATELRSVIAALTTSPSLRTTATFSLRHAEFESAASPYIENAVIATFGLRF